MLLSKHIPREDKTRNIVQPDFVVPGFHLDALYVFNPKQNEYKSFVDEHILPESIAFLDIIDVSKKGFSLVLELENGDRFVIVFENPFDLNKVVKLIHKGRDNREELKKSQLPILKFNIDYFEGLLRTEVQKDFTLQVR